MFETGLPQAKPWAMVLTFVSVPSIASRATFAILEECCEVLVFSVAQGCIYSTVCLCLYICTWLFFVCICFRSLCCVVSIPRCDCGGDRIADLQGMVLCMAQRWLFLIG